MKLNSHPLLRLAGVLLLSLLVCLPDAAFAQRKKSKKKEAPVVETTTYDQKLYDALQWRLVGPFRGGRSAAVTGVPGKPKLFYFGATGGGVWRTTDGGETWENISDGFFGGSIGAVTVAESDHNVIYVGGGEVTVRGNVSYGYGMWKSEDAGATWKHIGLENSRHIPRVRVHPKNENLVYAAVLGDLYKPTEERGVYRSKDGGQTWERILFANENAGAVDLILDPNNPRIIYASTWRVRRTPYSLESGGEGSALWKSTDGGDTWTNISSNPGLPKDTLGIIGIAVSPVNSNRVWAIIEAKNGGVFRSEDGGKTWRKLNDERALRQRAWYYSRIYADPQNEDVVYVMNVRYHKSTDGGRTFEAYNAPHGDHHDLWIAPEDPNRMIIADDGGAQVSYDGGKSWSTYYNQPTAQFYRVTTDNHFPYRIYAAQQDNSTVRIYHRTQGGSIGEDDWEPTAGCECGHIAIDPEDNDIVYGGCYDGLLERRNHKTGFSRSVNVWPDNPMGHGAEGMKYRFQWNYPIFFSPHDPNKLYTASNHLHVSYDEGNSWEVISPDLTRNDPTKLGPSGGPITKDNTSVEYYCTIFAAAESPRVKDLLWVGSDDGLVHVSRDGGKSWQNVTPPDLPEWTMINSIEPSPYEDGGCYFAATSYKLGDYRPYLYKTSDYGKTWTKIVNGIPDDHFTRVVRADPKRKGLLYAGTESGMYISFDDGASWNSFQLNLPIVPITDLTIKNDNLIAATQGRSLWMIDDLTVLHQLSDEIKTDAAFMYKPMDAWRMDGFQRKNLKTAGTNHPGGVNVYFYLPEFDTSKANVSIAFLEKDGDVIREFSTKAKKRDEKLDVKPGSNTFNWNMRYPDAKSFKGMILWWASLNGPQAVPGEYTVRLTVDSIVLEQPFKILKDPRSEVTVEDIQKQFDFAIEVRDKLTEAHTAIEEIRTLRSKAKEFTKTLDKKNEKLKPLIELSLEMDSVMTAVEEALYQTKNRARQDPLNFPIRLTNKLGHLNSLMRGDYPPTKQAIQVKEELTKEIDDWLAKYYEVRDQKVPQFNKLIRELEVDVLTVPKSE
ncbi:MAG: glycosyl hydrolase [Saprospirales bacterium]|nr:glycosyl hydrolase [Saprospirales bacterium]